jgi:hypothetical protein
LEYRLEIGRLEIVSAGLLRRSIRLRIKIGREPNTAFGQVEAKTIR